MDSMYRKLRMLQIVSKEIQIMSTGMEQLRSKEIQILSTGMEQFASSCMCFGVTNEDILGFWSSLKSDSQHVNLMRPEIN